MTNDQQGGPGVRRFTEQDLWGRDGQPGGNDVEQKRFGDCYFVSAAGAVAQQTPEIIRKAIAYDADTGNFSVRLFHQGEWTTTTVTQAELQDNLDRRGGSSFGSQAPQAGGGLWPAVYEVGYAKQRWGNWERGSEQLGKGGNPSEALEAITGTRPAQLDGETVLGLGARDVADRINRALDTGQRVLMSTNKDPWARIDGSMPNALWNLADSVRRPGTESDGVTGNHVYMVMGARYDAQSDETVLRIRNPWGHNRIRGKLGGINQEEYSHAAEIEVRLDDLIRDDTRSLNRFDIGRLGPQQRALFEEIRGQVKGLASEDAVALAASQANREGITSVSALKAIAVTEDGKLWIAGMVPGYRTMVDTHAPLPPAEASLRQLARESQVEAAVQAPDPLVVHRG